MLSHALNGNNKYHEDSRHVWGALQAENFRGEHF